MYDLTLRNALLADDTLIDIAIQSGKIAALGHLPAVATKKTLDLQGRWRVSPGWIDSHVHCYPASPIYNDEPDLIGIAGGVTTVIDAGSTGADDISTFHDLAKDCKTDVRALLNISRIGLRVQHELSDINDIDGGLAAEAIRAHRGFIVGIKARMSGSVVGENGIKPLYLAKAIQRDNGGLPLMVHVGNTPPDIDDIADLLEAGDIVTHCFNGKPNQILNGEGAIRAAILRAIERGVLMDVGHGSASLSFQVARKAMALGVYPNTISSDIYCRNRVKGPVFSLAHVMSKFLMLGMPLQQVLDCVTSRPAEMLRLQGKGCLEVGADADLTIFDIETASRSSVDSEGETAVCTQNLMPLAAIVAGELFPTEQGKNIDVFHL